MKESENTVSIITTYKLCPTSSDGEKGKDGLCQRQAGTVRERVGHSWIVSLEGSSPFS